MRLRAKVLKRCAKSTGTSWFRSRKIPGVPAAEICCRGDDTSQLLIRARNTVSSRFWRINKPEAGLLV